jgi:hypothetical protein
MALQNNTRFVEMKGRLYQVFPECLVFIVLVSLLPQTDFCLIGKNQFISMLKYHAMNLYGGGEEVQLHLFSISAPDGDDWPTSHSGRFILGERKPGTHWAGGCMGPEPVWTLWIPQSFSLYPIHSTD